MLTETPFYFCVGVSQFFGDQIFVNIQKGFIANFLPYYYQEHVIEYCEKVYERSGKTHIFCQPTIHVML